MSLLACAMSPPNGLAAEITAMGRRAVPCRWTSSTSARATPRSMRHRALGHLDILVNNAGGGSTSGRSKTSPKRTSIRPRPQRQVDLLLSQYVGRHMIGAQTRRHRQHGLAGRRHRAARRGDLLPEQGRRLAHDQVLRRRVGQAQCARQLRGADLLSDRRHGRHAGEPAFKADVSSASPRCTASASPARSPAPWCSSPRTRPR